MLQHYSRWVLGKSKMKVHLLASSSGYKGSKELLIKVSGNELYYSTINEGRKNCVCCHRRCRLGLDFKINWFVCLPPVGVVLLFFILSINLGLIYQIYQIVSGCFIVYCAFIKKSQEDKLVPLLAKSAFSRKRQIWRLNDGYLSKVLSEKPTPTSP